MGTIVSIDVAGPGDRPADDRVDARRSRPGVRLVPTRSRRAAPGSIRRSELMQLTAHARRCAMPSERHHSSRRSVRAGARGRNRRRLQSHARPRDGSARFQPRVPDRAGHNGRRSSRRRVSATATCHLDHAIERTIALTRPLVLDLGAVAEGTGGRSGRARAAPLRRFRHRRRRRPVSGRAAIAAGGPWRGASGIRAVDGPVASHPLCPNAAVCTSGDYERRASGGRAGIIIFSIPGRAHRPTALASATVVAPTGDGGRRVGDCRLRAGSGRRTRAAPAPRGGRVSDDARAEWVATPLMRRPLRLSTDARCDDSPGRFGDSSRHA